MKRLLGVIISVIVGFVAVTALVPQEGDGEWDDEGLTSWIGDLEKGADSASVMGDEDCARVLSDAAAGYGLATSVINDRTLESEENAWGRTRFNGSNITIWIDQEHSPHMYRTRIHEGLHAALRAAETFKNWASHSLANWWAGRCVRYVPKGESAH